MFTMNELLTNTNNTTDGKVINQMKTKILIIEDEEGIREMLGYTLLKEGYQLLEAACAEDAQQYLVAEDLPDLILLDWMLPGISGLEFLRRLRNNTETEQVPIIMVTAKGSETDKIQGLDIGADDYITKPFSTRELVARIKAIIRRSKKADSQGQISVKGLVLDPETYRVIANGTTIDISPTEFRLLHFFITHPERVYTRSQLLDQVWGRNVYVEERTVDVHIRRLRKILEPYNFDKLIQTVRSVGYRFSTVD